MNDLVKCARCKNTLIAESFDGHICTPRFRGTKTVIIDFFNIGKTSDGKTLILAKGMDGIMYSLIVNDQPSIPIPFNPSDESLQRKKSDEDLTEPLLGRYNKTQYVSTISI